MIVVLLPLTGRAALLRKRQGILRLALLRKDKAPYVSSPGELEA